MAGWRHRPYNLRRIHPVQPFQMLCKPITCLFALFAFMCGCADSKTADSVLAQQIEHIDAFVAASDAGDQKKMDDAMSKISTCQKQFERFTNEEQQKAMDNSGDKDFIAMARLTATKMGKKGEVRDAWVKREKELRDTSRK